MKITYKLNNDKFSYTQIAEDEEKKLNFLLTNNKGDFLNLGINKNSLKSQGLNFCDTNTLDIYKIIDNIFVPDLDIIEVENQGYSISRKYASKISQIVRVPVTDSQNNKSQYDEDAELKYNNNGVLQEVYEEENEITAQDRLYLGPSGGMIYEIENYEGNILLDLDIRKLNDLDEWGRDYNIYTKNNTVIVEYTKKVGDNQDYKVYFGIRTVNFQYDLLKDWVKQEYEYSKRRNSLYERYIYRLMSIRIQDSKRLYIGFGLSEKDVFDQISLLEQHYNELEVFDEAIYNDLTKAQTFKKPIPQDFMVAYRLSNYSMYNFFNRNLDNEEMKIGCFAGFPWFSQVWTRDELVGIKGFINNNEDNIVKEKLFEHLNLIDDNTGLIKRIKQKGALDSVDGVFWLAKRIEDFVFYLDTRKRLNNVISQGELEIIYNKLQ